VRGRGEIDRDRQTEKEERERGERRTWRKGENSQTSWLQKKMD